MTVDDEIMKETIDEPVYACDIYYDPERPELFHAIGERRVLQVRGGVNET